ncbi:MAG: hypothetical protein IPI85_16285 [Dehalococcoidia bacterium]|nr:hypothetical protein [Dehalococcoidia bacterium]
MGQKLQSRSKCVACQSEWAFPFQVAKMLDPWMVKGPKLHHLCPESCLPTLLANETLMRKLIEEFHPNVKDGVA